MTLTKAPHGDDGYLHPPTGAWVYREPNAPSHEWVVQMPDGACLYAPRLTDCRRFLESMWREARKEANRRVEG